MPGFQGLPDLLALTRNFRETRLRVIKNVRERVQDPFPPSSPSPDIHLMGAEAEVGVKNKAGGQVIILTQFSGRHSLRPHGALRTMLLWHRVWMCRSGAAWGVCGPQSLLICRRARGNQY